VDQGFIESALAFDALGSVTLPGQESQAEPDLGSEAERQRVERAKAGDPAVWGEWYDAYYKPLYRYAYIRLRRRNEAQDIVAEVFAEAYRGIGRYTYTGRPILAWLYRIAHNLIFDCLKAEARRAEREDDGTDARASSPEEQIASIDLLKALDSLSTEQRDVIVMRYFMSLPAQETAAIMGKSPTAVYSLQARALAALRQRLEED